jgi:hypothetical protein
MGKLTNEAVYLLVVKEIKPANSQFTSSSDRSITMYNHFFLMADDKGDEYPCQVSDVKQSQQYAEVGDRVEIKVSKFSKNVYTIKIQRVVEKFREPMGISPKSTLILTSVNPIVRGSAAEVALSLAIELFKYKEESVAYNVFTEAEKNFEWLCEKAGSKISQP